MRISVVGEDFFLEKFAKIPQNAPVIVGPGDDCCVLEIGDETVCVTVDSFSESTDFPEDMASYQMGLKSAGATLSDIAAMGASPICMLSSILLPKEAHKDELEEIVRGIEEMCDRFDLSLSGGDLGEAPELQITNTALGHADRYLMRSGAKRGDLICVTGELGAAVCGVLAMTMGEKVDPHLLNRACEPEPRIPEGLVLTRYVSACMDISDGLSTDLPRLCRRSSVGAVIYESKLPVGKATRDACKKMGRDVLDLALNGGEDYELLFTVPPKRISELEKDFKSLKTSLSVIGEITRDMGKTTLVMENGKKTNLRSKGWDPFRKK